MNDRPKFSLRTLLAVTGVVAAGAGLWTAQPGYSPDWRLGVATFLVMTALPACAIVGIIYGSRYGRAFSVGVLVPSLWGAVLLLMAMHSEGMVIVGRGTTHAAGKTLFTKLARYACEGVGAVTLCALAVGIISVAACWCIGDRESGQRD